MSSTNKKSQVIINLNKILNSNDSTEIRRMENEFELNGWCFVSLPTKLIPDSHLINELSEFFASDKRKDRYSQRPAIYGYSKVNHKEGIKLLTGSYFRKFANNRMVPETLVEPLNYLSQMLDAITKRLIEILDQHLVFQQKSSLLGLIESADLPFQDEHFGMLDIVSYFNKKSGFRPPSNGRTTNDVNCVPHYDPGLLSISILSTHEGLQLKSMVNDEWINGPLEPDIGVIWLGEAASQITQNRLKAGIHRVIYPQEPKCRLTIWYEVCTTEQLRNISADKNDGILANTIVKFKNLLGLTPIAVLPGESKLAFLKRVETVHGLSVSKSMPRFYHLQKHDLSAPATDLKTEL